AKLGLPADALHSFSSAFVEGMASANRSRILGDGGESAPSYWAWGGPETEADVLLFVFAKDAATLGPAVQGERGALRGLSLVVEPVDAQLWDDQKEHFGFNDGISQPVIEGSPKGVQLAARAQAAGPYEAANLIKAGEFILGYPNEYGQFADTI